MRAASVAWTEWGTAAFARANAENSPVFLYLFASWSAACADLEAHVFENPAVVALLDAAFVAVRVDVDLRPDIADRYGLGGWPTVLVLTPEGDILTGGRQLQADHLVEVLERVRLQFRSRRADLLRTAVNEERTPWAMPDAPADRPDEEAPAAFVQRAADAFSAPEGDTAAWLGNPTAIAALLAIAGRSGHARAQGLAEKFLDTALQRLFDHDRGVMFRPVEIAGRVTSEPVALLELNARFLEVLLDAVVILERDAYRVPAAAIASFLRNEMWLPAGGFRHVRAPAALMIAGSQSRQAPGVAAGDERRFVDGNAIAVRACLNAARVFGDQALGELAMEALEQVVMSAYQPGAGLAHVLDPLPRLRGLLVDQVNAAAALIEAFDATGMQVYLDLANELMRSALRKHRHAPTAALLDRLPTTAGAGDLGLLGRPLCPFALNSLAARVLLQLAARADGDDFDSQGRAILAGVTPLWPASGADGAHYALAILELQNN